MQFETTPDSPLLKALLARLLAADQVGDHSFSLSPAVVQSTTITDLFGSLLAQSSDTLPVTAATITSTATSVNLSATVDYPFAKGRSSTFVFLDVAGQLELELAVDALGELSIAALIAGKIVPASVYDPSIWAASLGPLQLQMQLDSQARALTFAGAPTAAPWTIGVGLVGVEIGNVTPALKILAPEGSSPARYLPEVTSTLSLGTPPQIPVLLRIPSGLDGWVITLGDSTGVLFDDLATFDPLMGGPNSGLPSALIALGGFRLTQLRFAFAPTAPDVWRIRALFDVVPTEATPWQLFNGLVEIQGISAGIDVTLYSGPGFDASASGFISGTLVVNETLMLAVGLAGPDIQGLWTLGGRAQLANFDVGALAAYLGGSAAPVESTLTRIGTQGFALTAIAMRLSLSGSSPGLRRLSIDVDVANWTIPGLTWFVIQELSLSLDIENPMQSDRVITGKVRGILTLGNVQVAVTVDFSDADQWHLQLAAFAAELTGLDQINITDLIPAADIGTFLPTGLPTDTSFGLGGFSMTYDTAKSFVTACSFDLEVNAGWSWANGALSLQQIEVHLQATRSAKGADPVVTGKIAGTVGLGGALFYLAAEKLASGDPWSFRGGLAEAYTVDFSAVLKQIAPTLQLPSAFQLPTSLTVLVADIIVTPATGAVDFSSEGAVAWSYDFGSTTVSITAIGGQLHLPGGGGQATGALAGNFSIGTVQGLASIVVGDGTVSDTIITVQVASGGATGVAALVDAVVGAGTYEGVGAPAAFPQPSGFASAALALNLTQSTLLLSGEISAGAGSMYGAAALLVGKDASARWGFVLAVALRNWTFAQISPALAGIDGIIGLTSANAAVALSLLDETAEAQVAAAVPAIGADMSIDPGLNFFGRLDFSDGWLENVSQIIAIQGPYTLSGHIPGDPTKPVTLRSTLGGLRLLGQFAFNQITLVYVRAPAAGSAPASNDLRLTGEIVATLDQAYTFKGDLHITSSAASFAVTTAARVANPLGIPGLALDKLGFSLACDFVGGQTTNLVVSFVGQVSFTSGPTLLGYVVLQDGTPTLVLIELETPDKQPAVLSISALFAQATGLTWPDAADVSLSKGQLWYVPGSAPVTYEGTTYQPGFHAGVQADIFFLPTVALDLAIYDGQSVAQPKGLTATAQFVAPVDWSFIAFAGTKDHGGPTAGPYFSVDTRNSQLPCTLGSGITLFGVSIGDITIKAGSQAMVGTLTLPSSAGIFADSSFSFTWDSDGFRVTDWPLKGLDLPAFALENIKGEGACSQVVLDLLPIDSKFDLDVSLSILPPQGGKPATLGVTLSGYFDLVVTSRAYANDPLLRAKIADTTISVPFPTSGGYDWGMLQDGMVQAIKDAGESIVQNLLLDPTNVAKLAAVVGVKWAISEAVDYLVCRGMTEEAAEGVVGLAASAEVSADVVVCAGATVAVGGVVGVIVGGVFINQAAPSNPSYPRPQKPGRPTLQFGGSTLNINWTATDPANTTSYAIALTDASGHTIPLSAVSAPNTSVPVGELTLGQVYTAQIIAAGPGGQSDPSDPGTLALLPAPSAPTLVFADPVLTASWPGVSGATGYQLIVLDATSTPVANPVITFGGTSTAVSAEVRAAAFEGGGSFTVQVTPTASGGPGPTGPPGSVTIALLAAPQAVTASTVGASLHVSWQLVPGATVYQGVVTDAHGGHTYFTTLATQGLSADVSGPSIVDGATLSVTVQAGASSAVGAVSAPLKITIDVLPVPTIGSFSYAVTGRQLSVAWAPIVRATAGYALQLSDVNDNPVTPASVTFAGASAVVSMGTLAAGTYNVRVRSLAPDAQGTWSPAVKVAILDLAAPANVRVILGSVKPLVRWTMVPNAQSYLLQVLDASHTPLNPQPSISYDALGATVDGSGFSRGAQYSIIVQAMAPDVVGPPSAAVTYTWTIETAWYTDGHDFQRTSRSSFPGPSGPQESWSVALTSGLLNASAVMAADGSVIMPTFEWLIAFEADGNERWRWQGPSAFLGTPTIGPDGAIYVTADGDSVSCVEANGTLRWQKKTTGSSGDAPSIAADGTVYVGTSPPTLSAINPDGSLKWIFGGSPAGWFYRTALGIDGTLYAGNSDGSLYAITPAGTLAWTYATGNRIMSSPVVGNDGSIYVGSWDGAFYAINPDGTLRWRHPLAAQYQFTGAAALAADGTIYVHLGDESLYAFNPDGSVKWRTVLGAPTQIQLLSRPAVDAAGIVYVGSESSKLFAIAPDGSIRWTKDFGFPGGYPVRSTPAIGTDGTLYLGVNDTQMHAIGPGTISGVNQVASVPSTEPCFAGYALGRYAIIAETQGGLFAYDVTTPSTPTQVLHVAEDGTYQVLAQRSYAGSYLYAGVNTSPNVVGLRIYDLSALPSALPKIGEAAGAAGSGMQPFDIAVAFPFAFVAAGDIGLLVFDISDPTNPRLSTTIPAPESDYTFAVAQGANWVYVGTDFSGLQIYEYPKRGVSPVLVGAIGTWTEVGHIVTIALYGPYAVLGSEFDSYEGVTVIDVSDPANPRLVSQYPVTGGVHSIVMRGSFAILSGNGYSAIVLDLIDPAHPTKITSLDTPLLGGQLSLVGTHAFVACGGLQVLELKTVPVHHDVLR